jgi:hypothetical protein
MKFGRAHPPCCVCQQRVVDTLQLLSAEQSQQNTGSVCVNGKAEARLEARAACHAVLRFAASLILPYGTPISARQHELKLTGRRQSLRQIRLQGGHVQSVFRYLYHTQVALWIREDRTCCVTTHSFPHGASSDSARPTAGPILPSPVSTMREAWPQGLKHMYSACEDWSLQGISD